MNVKHLKKLIIAVVCAGAVTGFCVTRPNIGIQTEALTNAEIQSQINSLNGKADKAKKELSDLKALVSSQKAEESNISAQIENLNHEIALIDEQLFLTESLIEQFEELTAQQTQQIAELEKEIEKEQRMLDDMIRMSFEYGDFGNAFEFIFSAEDFSDLLSRIDLISYHLSYNNKVLDNYNNSLISLENTKAEYERSIAEMNEYMEQQKALQAELEQKQREAEARRQELLANVESYESDLAAKQAAINELNNEVKRLAAMFAKEDDTTYSGIFQFPLPAKYRSSITSYYGYRKDPFTGQTAYHNGYDFAAPKGTEIYAADAGTVVIAGWNGGYGNCVTINHGGGIMSLYGHASSLNVVPGQQVKKGDVIAYVGTTGRSTGNHLHFTVYKNGNLTDPAPYIGLKV